MMGTVVNDETPPTPATPVATLDGASVIRIGRDEDNDIVLRDLWVSGKHAEIRRKGSGVVLVDLNSTNGLHYNGRRVPRATLSPGDVFTIGRHEFLWDGRAVYQHDDSGPTSVIADDLTVRVKGATLLDDVSFVLRHGTLLAVIGPSGCGKSTLLRSLTGFRKPAMGNILYDGKDLYEHYSELRYRIGMVPQDDVLHHQLTVRTALRFAAALRFASDVSRKERWTRVNEVIDLLGLSHRTKHRVDKLSGGQRKRTSVALELLTEPSLLALDEPTSGLDPALDKEVMRELRLLADRGRTIVVVTHSVLHLDICDYVLVMCLGGRMGYFGPPNELLPFFEASDYADVFDKVTNEAAYWAQKFRGSELYRRYIGEPGAELLAESQRKLLGNLELSDLDPTFSPLPTVRAQQPAPASPPPSRTGSLSAMAAKLAATEAAATAAVTAPAIPAQATPAEDAPLEAAPPPVDPVATPVASEATAQPGATALGGPGSELTVPASLMEPEPATADMPLTPEMAAAVPATHAAPPAAGSPTPATTASSAPATADAGKATTGKPATSKKAADKKVATKSSGARARIERGLDRVAAVVFRDALPPPPKEGPLKAVQDASVVQQTLHPVAPFRQYMTLCWRMVRVIFADRGYALFLLGLPIVLALLSKAIPGSNGLGEDQAGYNLEAQRRLAVFIVGAAFMGVAIAIREIVNEGSIYRRERAIGLSPTAYLASKVTIFVIIDFIQVVIFIYLSMWGLPRPVEPLILAMPMADIIIAVWLVAVASTAFGLLASALVRTTEQTTPILVISVMFQLVLSGCLFAVHGTPALEYAAYLDPARWGMAAAAASVDVRYLPSEIFDPIWMHRQENWWIPVGIMLVQIVALLGLTRLVLRRFEPGRY
jgi:ABC-type multidrug transport system ATPase subunit